MGLIRGTFDPESESKILKIIRSLGFLDLSSGPWVAGGAMRRLFMGQDLDGSDIDIFRSVTGKKYNNPFWIDEALRNRGDFKSYAITKFYSNYIMAAHDKSINLQVIHNKLFVSVEELLNSFDFTVCMAATDGWEYIMDERLLNDLKRRRIVINNPSSSGNWLIRLAKYCRYGFTPIPGTFSIVAGLDSKKCQDELSEKGFMRVKNDDY